MSELTPIMKQYLEMKADAGDALLLFRLGDFYEAFFDDAQIISGALSLVCTTRGTYVPDGAEKPVGIPMCGVPWHAAENYLARLVRGGYSVAIAEQMETPEQAKQRKHKQIERKIVRILSPGTLTDENLLNPKTSNFLIAIFPFDTSNQQPATINHYWIAGCDISTGEFFIGRSENIIDDMTRVGPAEIVYPAEFSETDDIVALRAIFHTTPVHAKQFDKSQPLARKYFENTGDSAAANVLAAYLDITGRGANITFRAPYEFGAGKQLLVDSATWKSLEIDTPLNDGGKTLLDVLDHTATAAGGRALRRNIRTLSGDIGVLRTRQITIAHLVINGPIRHQINSILAKTPDIARALSRLAAGRGMPRDLRCASDFLNVLPMLQMAARQLDERFVELADKIRLHSDLAAELNDALNEKLPAFFRDGGVIRDGFDSGLDNMKNLANGARDVIAALQSEYCSATGIPTLRIKHNNILGYHIEVPSSRAEPLFHASSGFIHRQSLSNNIRFTSARLIDLDTEVQSAATRALGMETEIINRLIADVLTISEDLSATADIAADMDFLTSLATVAAEYNWVRPELTSGTEFNITGGRHPVVESILLAQSDRFVKNGCDLTEKQVALLTGPNMAGKSTYLRQNALLVVLSHLGSFVPCDAAQIGICDQLFSRVGASDNLAAGQSTFMVEMRETANILNRATDRSFVIFDEIGRGTATFDGLSIAWAVLEFMDALRARCLFATHYHELTEIQTHNTTNLTIEVREHNNDIIFMHKIIPGR
ncbi:MAG: DNA mismatch repair protein MutS, partial [Rickettsiales bacterium]|nr:DNA mismatch repair protein MutS [Rickettsiales bacterium]